MRLQFPRITMEVQQPKMDLLVKNLDFSNGWHPSSPERQTNRYLLQVSSSPLAVIK